MGLTDDDVAILARLAPWADTAASSLAQTATDLDAILAGFSPQG
jgi:hypothetical protein